MVSSLLRFTWISMLLRFTLVSILILTPGSVLRADTSSGEDTTWDRLHVTNSLASTFLVPFSENLLSQPWLIPHGLHTLTELLSSHGREMLEKTLGHGPQSNPWVLLGSFFGLTAIAQKQKWKLSGHRHSEDGADHVSPTPRESVFTSVERPRSSTPAAMGSSVRVVSPSPHTVYDYQPLLKTQTIQSAQHALDQHYDEILYGSTESDPRLLHRAAAANRTSVSFQ